MKNKWKEIISAVALIVLILIASDAFGFYMNNMALASVIAAVIVLFIAFQIFIFKQKPADEREELHENVVSRFAYLLGSAVILIGIIIQSFAHNVDLWLVSALFVMILTRIIGIFYSERKM